VDGVTYPAALLLAGVFAWAGAAKLRMPGRTRATFEALGLPNPDALARAVPIFELGTAAALVILPAAGGIVALGALAFFTTLLVNRLRAGSRVSCGCFGTASDAPISFVEPVRNAVLGLAAIAAAFASGPVWPALDEVMVTSTAALVAALVLALCIVRRDVGAVWDNTLAGER
jgi:uncharacterized membrane protein YphA (DoxX/SURF4 family)